MAPFNVLIQAAKRSSSTVNSSTQSTLGKSASMNGRVQIISHTIHKKPSEHALQAFSIHHSRPNMLKLTYKPADCIDDRTKHVQICRLTS